MGAFIMRVKFRIKEMTHHSGALPTHKKWRPKYTIHRMQWEINPYDDDDFPSVPHADSVEPYHLYKIDLLDGVGTIYRDREKCGHLSKKDYNRLMKDVRKRNIIKIARDYYREQHPYINLPFLDEERCIKVVHQSASIQRKAPRLIFACRWIEEK